MLGLLAGPQHHLGHLHVQSEHAESQTTVPIIRRMLAFQAESERPLNGATLGLGTDGFGTAFGISCVTRKAADRTFFSLVRNVRCVLFHPCTCVQTQHDVLVPGFSNPPN